MKEGIAQRYSLACLGRTRTRVPHFLEDTMALFISALPQCGVYSRAALIQGRRLIPLRVLTCNLVPSSATAMRRLFEGSAYSRAAFNSVTGTHV